MFRIEAFSEDQSCITLKAVSNNVTVELSGERPHVKSWGGGCSLENLN